MKEQKLAAINEMTSPLFRIMSVHNSNEVARRKFNNNICAFHIGDGYLLSVAHNLRSDAGILLSLTNEIFQDEIVRHLSNSEKELFNRCYVLDGTTNKRYVNIVDPGDEIKIIQALRRIDFDTRFVTLYQRQICKPYLIVQQSCTHYYGTIAVGTHIDPSLIFAENQYQTYLLELELVEAYYEEDVCLYRITNTDQILINPIPRIEIDSEIYDTVEGDYFCLQSAPAGTNLGRLLNEASIEGLIDQHAPVIDRIGGNYFLKGFRYLIKGYFRFGSSGAPYIKFDKATRRFKVNAIQSEACPVQLTINNNRETNFQWVKAIATPLSNVIERLNRHIKN
jgi:hypothetical protein